MPGRSARLGTARCGAPARAAAPDAPARRRFPGRRAGGCLFLSGQVGSREDGAPEPDLDAQVRRAFGNLNAILAAAGCRFEDVVDVAVFIVDPQSTFELISSVALELWGEAPYPNITAVGVTWLDGFEFEIKVIARLPHA